MQIEHTLLQKKTSTMIYIYIYISCEKCSSDQKRTHMHDKVDLILGLPSIWSIKNIE